MQGSFWVSVKALKASPQIKNQVKPDSANEELIMTIILCFRCQNVIETEPVRLTTTLCQSCLPKQNEWTKIHSQFDEKLVDWEVGSIERLPQTKKRKLLKKGEVILIFEDEEGDDCRWRRDKVEDVDIYKSEILTCGGNKVGLNEVDYWKPLFYPVKGDEILIYHSTKRKWNLEEALFIDIKRRLIYTNFGGEVPLDDDNDELWMFKFSVGDYVITKGRDQRDGNVVGVVWDNEVIVLENKAARTRFSSRSLGV